MGSPVPGRVRRSFFNNGLCGLRRGQGRDDLSFALVARRIAIGCQFVRIALAGDNIPNDRKPSHASDVAEHVGQLEVHQMFTCLWVYGAAIGPGSTL